MDQQGSNFHYVCTLDEARQMVAERDRFWMSNCECREERGPCKRSGIFLCLQFDETKVPLGSGRREVTREEVLKALAEAEKTHLVPRPFRDYDDKENTYGICFCCDCCCDYFATENPSPCDRGLYIEQTDEELCNHCGTCEEFCYFGARVFDGEFLEVHPDECYGCGVCVDVCPEGAVEMVLREIIV